ncbi:gephyrin-like molybdotransferase receptor GlpR [Corynebacterium sp. LK2522]|uniref:divisome protein SepX/GlpR n=1 Tax=Corynebacterium sp. LK2522 TaxID=3110474 RepID=UPI0034CDEB43
MSPGLILILILVVWLFVLAPWLLRGQRPVSHTGDGFEDTRVLFEGDQGKVAGRRKPRVTAQDVHRTDADDDYEIVDAEPASLAVPVSAQEETIDGEVVDSPLLDDAPAADAETGEDAPAEDSEGAEDLTAEEAPEYFDPPQVDEVAADAYPLDASYTSPVDLMYPGAVDADAAATASAAEETAEAAEATEEAEISGDDELSAEELEFAKRRLGRGGWDPEADKAASTDRYQRRQRTLLGLAVAVVATVALGIILGGWGWLPAAVVAVLSVVYLVALRTQVRQEQALRHRRVRQLRRARLGVRNAADEELAIPRSLRRPGAVVLEVDDDSPDFDHLPVYYHDDDSTGDRAPVRRDDLAARRVG